MSSNSIIELKNVGLSYTQADRTSATILSNIDLKITQPSIVQIIGPSGSGKSKLIRLLNRLEDATLGEIDIYGQNIKSIPILKLRRTIQMMQQEPVLVADTVMDNLMLPWTIIGESLPDDFNDQAEQALVHAKLEIDRMSQKVDQLSVGQKQRVSFARAMLTKPQILLLDEPTSALDTNLAFELLDTIRSVQSEQQMTVLMVTHRMDEVKYINDHVAIISAGQLLEFGTTDNILNNSSNPNTLEFLKNYLRTERNGDIT